VYLIVENFEKMNKGVKKVIGGVILALAIIVSWLLWQYFQAPTLPDGFAG
jgi:predicted negative regulator of RcsB-dependent stress response